MTSPRTPRQLSGWTVPDHVDFQVSTGDVHLNCFYPGCGATTRVWQIGAAGWDVGPWVSDHAHGETVGPLSEVLPETPEPPRAHVSMLNVGGDRPCDCAVGRDHIGPRSGVPASQSVPAVPVSSTGGKETGEAAETATEALRDTLAALVDPDVWAAREDNQDTVGAQWQHTDRRRLSLAAAERILAAGWRPPLPAAQVEIDDEADAWYVRVLDVDVDHTTESAPVNLDWTRDGQLIGVELLGPLKRPSSPLPDSETEKAAIESAALVAAANAARQCAREAEQADMDDSIRRHWRATSSFLRRRAAQITAGEEPDWPDAANSARDEGNVTDPVPWIEVTS